MLAEPGNQFSLTRAALSTCAAPKTQILISFSTVLGKVYSVEYSATLKGWTVLKSGIAGTGGMVEFDDPSVGGNSRRFYRLRIGQ